MPLLFSDIDDDLSVSTPVPPSSYEVDVTSTSTVSRPAVTTVSEEDEIEVRGATYTRRTRSKRRTRSNGGDFRKSDEETGTRTESDRDPEEEEEESYPDDIIYPKVETSDASSPSPAARARYQSSASSGKRIRGRWRGDSDPMKEYSEEIESGSRRRENVDCTELLRGCWYTISVLGLIVALTHLIAAGSFFEARAGDVWRDELNVSGGWSWGLGLGLTAAVIGSWLILALILGWFVAKGRGGAGLLCVWLVMMFVGILGLVLLIGFSLAVGFGWRHDDLRDAAREGWEITLNENVGNACQYEEDNLCTGFYATDCFPEVQVIEGGDSFEGGGAALCANCTTSPDNLQDPIVLQQGCFRALTRFLRTWYLVIGFTAFAIILLLIPYFIIVPILLGVVRN